MREPIEVYDSGEEVYLDSYAGGAAPGGAWSTLSLRFRAADGTDQVRSYTADGPAHPYDVQPG